MKIPCSMAEDLLPLYVEDSCSADSRKALEEHIKDCPNCRDTYARMTAPEIPAEEAAPLVDCGKKIKRKRTTKRILLAFLVPVLTIVLTILLLTLFDMCFYNTPVEYELTTNSEDVSKYVFRTNSEQLTITTNQPGEVMLSYTEAPNEYILFATLDEEDYFPSTDSYSVEFTNLSSRYQYVVTCKDMGHAQVTVTDGKIVNFWYSLEGVLGWIGDMLFWLFP